MLSSADPPTCAFTHEEAGLFYFGKTWSLLITQLVDQSYSVLEHLIRGNISHRAVVARHAMQWPVQEVRR